MLNDAVCCLLFTNQPPAKQASKQQPWLADFFETTRMHAWRVVLSLATS